ncbi:MAG: diguanylate cyclase [Candidatus Omnitrophica bacterium]|nr:diguanylate cyclase [Candidatus Omnitrophota bacterium]MBU4477670.1 diguanylate cyclase [Candidatus Omnitrophota bacterium]MCG2704337.1 diguanylate cyclase [Candidatus Omnitrophota bacterium]
MKNRILVVDDTITDVLYLKKVLENVNYEVSYAENGNSALSLLEKDTPDMVILDILLPDIDGFEVCKRIRANDRFLTLPILFYSAIRTTDDKLLGLEMGASDFLSKSADERELLIRIKNLLKTKSKIDTAINSSLVDSITNVYSSQYFQHRIHDECIRSRRYKRDLSCMIVDVDNFKTINTTFGYQTGNRVLRKIADLVRQNIRSADEVCRYKEDEFGVLLPETNLRDAFSVAERVRQFMALSDAIRTECTVDLTVSCGISYFSNDVKDMTDLVAQATLALRQAKMEGRNQTRFFQGR